MFAVDVTSVGFLIENTQGMFFPIFPEIEKWAHMANICVLKKLVSRGVLAQYRSFDLKIDFLLSWNYRTRIKCDLWYARALTFLDE